MGKMIGDRPQSNQSKGSAGQAGLGLQPTSRFAHELVADTRIQKSTTLLTAWSLMLKFFSCSVPSSSLILKASDSVARRFFEANSFTAGRVLTDIGKSSGRL